MSNKDKNRKAPEAEPAKNEAPAKDAADEAAKAEGAEAKNAAETGSGSREGAEAAPCGDAGEKTGGNASETGEPKDGDGANANGGSKPEGGEKTGGEPEKPAPEKKEDEDLRTQYLRLAADFQNFRKRTEKEKSDIYARANESLMTDLLPVLDDFERALAVKDEAAKGVQEGVRMIVEKYVAALKKHGLFEIEALGMDFDPNFHHAVQTCPAENGNEGKIATVLQKGYLLNGKVIRPAMVIVAE